MPKRNGPPLDTGRATNSATRRRARSSSASSVSAWAAASPPSRATTISWTTYSPAANRARYDVRTATCHADMRVDPEIFHRGLSGIVATAAISAAMTSATDVKIASGDGGFAVPRTASTTRIASAATTAGTSCPKSLRRWRLVRLGIVGLPILARFRVPRRHVDGHASLQVASNFPRHNVCDRVDCIGLRQVELAATYRWMGLESCACGFFDRSVAGER